MTSPRHPERSEGSVRLYPYAVTHSSSLPFRSLAGLRGAPVSHVTAGLVAAWTSALEPFTPSREDLATHHAVVVAAFEQGPCLPLRFGTSFASEDELRTALSRKERALASQLDRLAGKAEIAVTLEWTEPAASPIAALAGANPAAAESPSPATAGPGRRFLDEVRARQGAREARRLRAESLAQDLQSTFGPLAQEDVNLRICPADRVALSCAVLIDAARGGAVIDEVRRAAAVWRDVRLHLAGPWPPYSFSAPD